MRKSILRFGALALMSMMSINVFAFTFTAVENKGEYKSNSDGTNTVTLTKANKNNTKGGQEVYGTVQDSNGIEYTVTAIGTRAFKNAIGGAVTSVTSVALSVKTVENYAFEGVSSLTIYLTQLEKIGEFAFQNVTFDENGTAVTAPVEINASSIGKGAFKGTSLVAVKWGASIAPTTVPEECFAGCSALTDFEFGRISEGVDYVTKIGKGAFSNCTLLEKFGWLTTAGSEYCLPTTLERIEEKAFNGCTALANLKFSNQAQPDIAYVGPYAFQSSSLKSDSFNKIFTNEDEDCIEFAEHAFSGVVNVNFTNIVLPKNVKLGKETFSGSTKLTAVTFKGLSGELSEGCFSGCTALTTLNDFNILTITNIPKKAFLNSGITAIDFPSTVTTIGEQAFDGCGALYAGGALTLPEGITQISKKAFANTTFTTLTLPASLSSANGTETIGQEAFAGNTSIAVINLKGSNASAGIFKPADKIYCSSLDDTFAAAVYTNATLNVPYGCYEIYTDQSTAGTPAQKVNKTWYKFAVANVWTPAAKYAFGEVFYVNGLGYEVTKNDGQGVATVKVVDGLYVRNSLKPSDANKYSDIKNQETHKDWVYAPYLTTDIVIPQYVTTSYDESNVSPNVPSNAYYKVTGLQSVNAQDLVIAAGDTEDLKALKNATRSGIEAVTTVTIKAAGIDVPAIFNCVVPETGAADYGQFKALATFKTDGEGSIKSLEEKAFYKSSNLETVEIKTTDGFTTIPTQAFSQCQKLEKFTIPTTVKYIYSSAFQSTALTDIILPDGLTHINTKAFYNTKLISINIPASVQSIGKNAFSFGYNSVTKTESGVKNVYFNWTGTISATIDSEAFGTALSETKGDRTVYHLRNLHYPAGQNTYYLEVAMFKEAAHLFSTVEGIIVNGKNKYLVCSDDNPNEDPSIVLEDATDVREDLSVTTSVSIARELPVKVTYMREFKSDKWQCWFVPFNYEYTEESPAKFAYLYDTKLDDNGYIMFEYKEVPKGTIIKANVPYLVKPNAIDDIPFYADNLQKTQPTDITVSDAKNGYTFSGVYTKKEYNMSEVTKWYGLFAETGVFRPAESGAYINAYRFYMTVSPGTNPYGLVKVVVLDNEDATGIESINAESLSAPMYDVMGRQIAAPAKGQVYIQNGVKKLAK